MGNLKKTHHGTSRFKGVCWDRTKRKWMAYINVGGTRLTLGYFLQEEDAARAYDAVATREFGEYARPNFQEARREAVSASQPRPAVHVLATVGTDYLVGTQDLLWE